MVTMPYFMFNPEWYYFSEETLKYELTDKAPEEAKASLEQYYKDVANSVMVLE